MRTASAARYGSRWPIPRRVARERGHLGEEIGVAGEVHARRAGDSEADRGGGRTERPPSSVVHSRHRFDRQSPDRKPVADGELFDLVPGRANERAETGRHDDARAATNTQ